MKTDTRSLIAADIMTRSLVSTRPDDPLQQAERLMIEHRVSGLPVVVEGKLVGVLSRSDIARVEILLQSLDEEVSDEMQWDEQADGFQHPREPDFQGFSERLAKLKVRDAMTDRVITCSPQTPVPKVAAEMIQHHIHRLIVVEEGHPRGIISSLDIVRLVAQEG